MLSYRQLKWLILIIPTITIGVWEYVRHEFLLPYISMELGNILAPILVLLVTLLISTQLFSIIERIQQELNQSKALEAVLKEREKIAQQLHDGIAQSIFFLNVQLKRIEQKKEMNDEALQKLKETIIRTNEYVRQAIAALRNTASSTKLPWLESIESLIQDIKQETGLTIETKWSITANRLNDKEKIELLAIMREVLINIYKHAKATYVSITIEDEDQGWVCKIMDNGLEHKDTQPHTELHFGMKIMKSRAANMNWSYIFYYDYKQQLNVFELKERSEQHE